MKPVFESSFITVVSEVRKTTGTIQQVGTHLEGIIRMASYSLRPRPHRKAPFQPTTTTADLGPADCSQHQSGEQHLPTISNQNKEIRKDLYPKDNWAQETQRQSDQPAPTYTSGAYPSLLHNTQPDSNMGPYGETYTSRAFLTFRSPQDQRTYISGAPGEPKLNNEYSHLDIPDCSIWTGADNPKFLKQEQEDKAWRIEPVSLKHHIPSHPRGKTSPQNTSTQTSHGSSIYFSDTNSMISGTKFQERDPQMSSPTPSWETERNDLADIQTERTYRWICHNDKWLQNSDQICHPSNQQLQAETSRQANFPRLAHDAYKQESFHHIKEVEPRETLSYHPTNINEGRQIYYDSRPRGGSFNTLPRPHPVDHRPRTYSFDTWSLSTRAKMPYMQGSGGTIGNKEVSRPENYQIFHNQMYDQIQESPRTYIPPRQGHSFWQHDPDQPEPPRQVINNPDIQNQPYHYQLQEDQNRLSNGQYSTRPYRSYERQQYNDYHSQPGELLHHRYHITQDTPTITYSQDTKPPTFNGQGNFDDFIIQFDCLAKLKNWNEREKSAKLVCALEGQASGILGTLPEEMRTNYDALKEALRSRFSPKLDLDIAGSLHQNRRKRRGESYIAYVQDLRKMVQSAYGPGWSSQQIEVLTREKFFNSIDDFQLKGLIWARKPGSAEEAAILADSLDNLQAKERPDSLETFEITGLVNTSSFSKSTSTSQLPRSNQGLNNNIQMNLQQGPLIKVKVEGIDGTTLLDTGASKSTISHQFFIKLLHKDIPYHRTKTKITVADGNTHEDESTIIATLKIEFKEYGMVQHEFLVVNFPAYDLIIGWDFMKQHNASIDAGTGKFTIKTDPGGKGHEPIIEGEDILQNKISGFQNRVLEETSTIMDIQINEQSNCTTMRPISSQDVPTLVPPPPQSRKANKSGDNPKINTSLPDGEQTTTPTEAKQALKPKTQKSKTQKPKGPEAVEPQTRISTQEDDCANPTTKRKNNSGILLCYTCDRNFGKKTKSHRKKLLTHRKSCFEVPLQVTLGLVPLSSASEIPQPTPEKPPPTGQSSRASQLRKYQSVNNPGGLLKPEGECTDGSVWRSLRGVIRDVAGSSVPYLV